MKRVKHREIASAQDLIVEELFSIFDDAIMHGGTAIWRCYQGNRFSEDIDIYIQKNEERLNLLFSNLKKRGFLIEKRKISQNSLFSKLKLNNAIVRLEGIFKKQEGILKEYETVEGNLITVNTLSSEELIKEKINAYIKRQKIRDLYDVFFLLRHVKDKEKIKKNLKILLKDFKKPIDEGELKILILEGLVPNVEKMVQYIRSFL